MLSLDSMFRRDYDNGVLEQIMCGAHAPFLVVLVRIAVQWLSTGVLLALLSPLLCVMLGIPLDVIGIVMVALLVGTPAVSLLGALGAALTVGFSRGGTILGLLVLPLLLPVLVFGTSAINQAVAGMEYQAQLYWMGFISMLSLTIGPLATTAGLRISLQVQWLTHRSKRTYMSLGTTLRQFWHKLGSPRWFYQMSRPWVGVLGFAALMLLGVGVVWGLAFAPEDYQQGNSFRIIYVHVPAAMVAQSVYMGMGVAGLVLFVWRMKLADVAIAACLPFGMALTAAGPVQRRCVGPTDLGYLVGMGWTHRLNAGVAVLVCGYICLA